MKRIFIAFKVEAGETFKEILSSLRSGLGKESIRWINLDNIHITLVFLGNTQESTIDSIISLLREKCKETEEFSILIKGCGVFRKNKDPRILWAGIKPSDRLTQLYDSISDGLKQLNIKVEERPYKPHLTIGRVTHLQDKELLDTLVKKFQYSEIQTVRVNEVILYESVLYQSGPVYIPLEKFRLL
jgi:RNA 2',3'-cyclic 3'-phosphodiesterase